MRTRWVVLGLSCFAVVGCSSSDKTDPKQAARDNPDQFEEAKDPPVVAETHIAAARFAESQGNVAKAIEQYQAAVKLQPKHQTAHYRLGVLCTQAKLYPQAVTAWKGYIKATDEAAAGYSNLAFTLQVSGDEEAAEQAYKTGIGKDPRNRPCRVNYGLLLARQGKFDSAVEQWQAVLTPGEVHYNLAGVHEMRKEFAQAKAEYRKALEIDPSLADAKAKLARLDQE